MAEEASLAIILRARDEASATIEKAGLSVGGLAKAALAAGAVVGIAAVGMGVVATKLAADFQYTTETLVTGAGEDQKALEMVRQGVLAMAGEVGQTPQHLAEGLYLIESAGFHGAAGLKVLESAAKGATVGGAQMAEVADALTSALNAYRLPASEATHITDILLTTVAAGKMHLSDLAGNIGKVLPIASAAHVPISQLAAAIATMTSQGTDAAMATTALRFLITNLISPSAAAAGEMQKMGLSAKDLYNDLSQKGLTGALADIQDHLSKKFPVGSQAYIAALDKIVGGTRGMTAALELTGTNMATFVQNANNIGHASDGAGKLMQGWEEHSKDFNIVMERLKAGLEAVLITVGNQLLPVLTQFALWFVGNLPQMQAFADQGIARVKQALIDAKPYVEDLRRVLGFLADNATLVKGVMIVLTSVWLAFQAAMGIQALLTFGAAFLTFAGEQGVAAAAATALGVAETFALWPIALIVLGIAALIAIFIIAITHTKEIGNAFSWLGTQASAVWNVIVTDVMNMVGALMGHLTDLWNRIKGTWDSLVATAEAAWKDFTSRPIYWIVYLVSTVIMWMLDLHIRIVTALTNMVIAAGIAGLNFANSFAGFIQQLPSRIWVFLASLLVSVATWELNMIAFAASAGGRFVNAVSTEISRLPGQIGGWLASVGVAVQNQGPPITAKGLQIAQNFIRAILNELTSLPGQVANAVGAAFGNVGGQVSAALHAAHVPGFATGAVVRAGGGGVIARIGEGSEDEVVNTATQMAQIGANVARGGGAGGTQTIIVPVSIDGKVIAQVVAEYQGKQFSLQGGRLGSGAG